VKQTAAYWINRLQLNKHPEGGWFRETYRSGFSFPKEQLPDSFHGDRNFSTAIYFLLERDGFSAFHRIASDELWHFYSGDALIIYELETDGSVKEHYLGNDAEKGEVFQAVVKAGNWFASRLREQATEYALAGCTVAPGFDFADFEMAERSELIKQYPQHAGLISSLTR
jgi:predicted cupin superfamily sugar epimerase